jgi:hypothetical protein
MPGVGQVGALCFRKAPCLGSVPKGGTLANSADGPPPRHGATLLVMIAVVFFSKLRLGSKESGS